MKIETPNLNRAFGMLWKFHGGQDDELDAELELAEAELRTLKDKAAKYDDLCR